MTLDRGARPNFPRQMPATKAECDALEIARQRATGEQSQPRDEWGNGSRNGWFGNRHRPTTGIGGIGTAIVNDGSGYYAQVHWEGPNFKTYCYIRQPSGDPNDIHGHDVKCWNGIPKWEDATMAPFTRIRGGSLNIQAPGRQVHVVEEHIDIVHQPVINHHYAQAQVVQHGQPQHHQVGVDPTQVRVQHSDHVQVEHHAPKQSALNAMLFGVRRPQQQQQALPPPQQSYAPPRQQALPAPQAVDRGFLLPVPTQPQQRGRPLAIPHQPEVPMQAQRKKSRSWI